MSENNFGIYFAARMRGMKSHLLTRASFDEMLEADAVQGTVDKLLASDYAEEMADALTRAEGADAVEDAVSRNLVQTYQRLFRNISDEDYKRLAAVFIQRWDLTAIKSLLRCTHHGIEVDAGEVIPGPTLTVAIQQELAQRGSMAELVGGLVSWNASLCAPLQRALPDYDASNDLAVLEEALDRGYFVANAKALRQDESSDASIIRQFLQMEIDRINLRALLTMRESGNLAERILPGGTIASDVLDRMVNAANGEEAIAALEKTRYAGLAEGIFEFVQANRFGQIERLFERDLMNRIRKSARVEVFSIAVFMEYAWLKYNEVLNLRLVARGESRHLPKARIREEMVYV